MYKVVKYCSTRLKQPAVIEYEQIKFKNSNTNRAGPNYISGGSRIKNK